MLLIHVPRLTNRLGYTLNVLFHHLLRADFSITTDEGYFADYRGEKMSYGPRKVGDGLYVKSAGLLFSTSIEDQEPRPELRDGEWTLFPTYVKGSDIEFDILAATFYMVSRYEEYLPHREDRHGRFPAEESIACQHGFLEVPVVDRWAILLRDKIKERYPEAYFPERTYRYVQTVDIDAAWCYRNKGLARTVAGMARDLLAARDIEAVRLRLRVLLHKEPDPFDTFDYLLEQNRKAAGVPLLFFVLLADYDRYDKPANYLNPKMRDLVQHIDDLAATGIHLGYGTQDNPPNADKEAGRLEQIVHRSTTRARYHFLRLQLPWSYRILQRAGITDDYTMGYPDAVGFRAGTSEAYPFYDLERDSETELMVHPFCAMDTAMKMHLGLTAAEAETTYRRLIDNVRAVGGVFCSIVHNQNLCERFGWEGWRTVYERTVDYAMPEQATINEKMTDD